jgi:DNA-binding MarR family transcriptional regulator
VGRGLVERLREDRDRRVVRIQLTDEGNAMCRAIHEENDLHCRRVLERIPLSERGEVIRCFETLVQAFLDSEAESVVRGCADPAPTGSEEGSS